MRFLGQHSENLTGEKIARAGGSCASWAALTARGVAPLEKKRRAA